MKKIAILTCYGLFILASCDSFLNVKPKGETIPEYYEDYARLLNDDKMSKAADINPPNLTDDVLYPGGNLPYYLSSRPEEIRNLYMFNHGAILPEGESDDFWEAAYNRLFTFNAVINNIMSVPDATDADKRTLQAEALVGRAFEYLTLVSAYAPAYDPATASTDYGVPLILTEDIGKMEGYPRNTVAEVYEQIEKDLEIALPHLKTTPPNSFHPSRSVGLGFFARLYLLQRDYAKSLDFAQQAVEQNESVVDLKLYTVLPRKMTGRIVLASDGITPYPDGDDNPESIYVRYASYVYGLSGKVYASDDLLDVYDRDLPAGAIDLRRDYWFVQDGYTGIGNFPGYTMWLPFVAANLGLNTVDNMLMAAECYARRGGADDLTEAARLYNKLRDNRIQGNEHVAFANADDALLKVLDERRREFPFTGIYRLVDLKRLNKEERFAKTVVHAGENETTYSLPPNDNRYILPLPPKVKSFRPDLPDYER